MIYKTVEEANIACAKWQKILRLQDWDIVIEITGRSKMGENLGYNTTFPEQRLVKIDLLIHSDADSSYVVPYDMEFVLVHELLHIQWTHYVVSLGIEESPLSKMLLEQNINQNAQSLVNLERRSTGSNQLILEGDSSQGRDSEVA